MKDILVKSFPFINFTFIKNGNIINILINNQHVATTAFFTIDFTEGWIIKTMKKGNFENFLNNFIKGLCKNEIY